MSLMANLLVKGHNILGEGPLWISESKILTWTDIMSNCIYFMDLEKGIIKHHNFKTYIACMGEGKDGSLIAAAGSGVVILSRDFALNATLSPVPFKKENVRFNDGKIGPDGAFWAGTMDLKAQNPIASLYRISEGNITDYNKISIKKMEHNLTISNGIGWSPDSKIMYLTDSRESVIYSYDFDKDSGTISNKEIFIQDLERPGVPDGLAVDVDGNIWSARWGGSVVVCYDSEGKEKETISLPVSNVTSCCFGGENLETLYITTASYSVKKAGDLDGGLFECRTGTTGQLINKFGEKK